MVRHRWCKQIVAGGVIAILAASAIWLPNEAQAVPVTFEFSGTVTSLLGSSVGGPVALNDTFTGSYTFESTTVGTGSCAGTGNCQYNDAISSLNFTVGSYTNTGVTSGTNYIFVNNDDSGYDLYQVIQGFSGPSINGAQAQTFNLTLFDSLMTMLSGTSLPTTPPTFPGSHEFIITFYNGLGGPGDNVGQIYGNLTSLAPVPVPSTVWLFGGGFVILALWRLRAQRLGQTVS